MLHALLASLFFYVNTPVVEMRSLPDAASEIVSQGLLGEEVVIEGESFEWLRIQTPDGYKGWVPKSSLTMRSTPYEPNARTARLKSYLYDRQEVFYGPSLALPYNSPLHVIERDTERWIQVSLPDERIFYIQKGELESIRYKEEQLTREALPLFALKFLGIPYTWGGRSSFGYDCSGFVQMVYGKMGIDLSRDARDQILDTRFQDIEEEDLLPGDLIFFGASEEKITHVGIYLYFGVFIHATVKENKPWIHLSLLTDELWRGEETSACPYRAFRQLARN